MAPEAILILMGGAAISIPLGLALATYKTPIDLIIEMSFTPFGLESINGKRSQAQNRQADSIGEPVTGGEA